MKKRVCFLFLLVLPSLMIFSNPDEEYHTEVIIIDILSPSFYSGRFFTYYTIFAYEENGIKIFYYPCFIKSINEESENDINLTDIEKDKKYFFYYKQCFIDGYIYNSFEIKQNGNLLLEYQKVCNDDQKRSVDK